MPRAQASGLRGEKLLRILHLDAGREMRGGQWQVLRLIEGLASLGVESTLLARESGALFSAARKLGWRVEGLGLTRAWRSVSRHDLVHAHDARSHTLGALLTASRLVVSRRVAFPVGSRWKYGRASRYLAVSEFVRGVLVAGGVPESKISVVYDGVPMLDRAEPRGTVLTTHKGGTLAAEAARLAGISQTVSAKLEEDLPHASMLVYVSHSEGLGSGALLAMSAGVPVIASRVGGLTEIIEHEKTGLLVENDAAAIAAAIRRVAGDAELARRLGHAAREAVRARFTVEEMVRRTMEVYRLVNR